MPVPGLSSPKPQTGPWARGDETIHCVGGFLKKSFNEQPGFKNYELFYRFLPMRIQTQVKSFAPDHKAFKWQNHNTNPGGLAAKFLPLHVVQELLRHYQLPCAISRALAAHI